MKWKKICAVIFAAGITTLGAIVSYVGVKKYYNRRHSNDTDPIVSAPPFYRNITNPIIDNLSISDVERLIEIPYDKLVYLLPHNSYSSSTNGYVIDPQQSTNVYEQIVTHSARGVDLDFWWYQNSIRLCHSECGSQTMKLIRPFGSNGESAESFIVDGIMKFLDQTTSNTYITVKEASDIISSVRFSRSMTKDISINVYELLRRPPILTFVLENYVTNVSNINMLIEKTGLSRYVFSPQDYYIQENRGKWWSLSKMIQSKKVVVILSNSRSKYTFDIHDVTKESNFPTTITFDSTVDVKDICSNLRGRGSDLLLLHYYPQFAEGNDFNIINTQFPPFLNTCLSDGIGDLKNRYPNFIKADMIHKGNIFETSIKDMIDTIIADVITNNFNFSNIERLRSL